MAKIKILLMGIIFILLSIFVSSYSFKNNSKVDIRCQFVNESEEVNCVTTSVHLYYPDINDTTYEDGLAQEVTGGFWNYTTVNIITQTGVHRVLCNCSISIFNQKKWNEIFRITERPLSEVINESFIIINKTNTTVYNISITSQNIYDYLTSNVYNTLASIQNWLNQNASNQQNISNLWDRTLSIEKNTTIMLGNLSSIRNDAYEMNDSIKQDFQRAYDNLTTIKIQTDNILNNITNSAIPKLNGVLNNISGINQTLEELELDLWSVWKDVNLTKIYIQNHSSTEDLRFDDMLKNVSLIINKFNCSSWGSGPQVCDKLYSINYTLELTWQLLQTNNITLNRLWERFERTNSSVIINETLINGNLTSINSIKINYTIQVPPKTGFNNSDYLPIRIYYWFIDSNGNCISQLEYKSAEPYCQPLQVETVGLVEGFNNFTVELNPALERGNYTVWREIQIDPPVNNQPIWQKYGSQTIGNINVISNKLELLKKVNDEYLIPITTHSKVDKMSLNVLLIILISVIILLVSTLFRKKNKPNIVYFLLTFLIFIPFVHSAGLSFNVEAVNTTNRSDDSYILNESINRNYQAILNQRPIFSNIPDITWYKNNNLSINLTFYFSDPDYDELTYNFSFIFNNTANLTITQNDSRFVIFPDINFTGVRWIIFTAKDSYAITLSNNISLTVIELPETPSGTGTSGGYGSGTSYYGGWSSLYSGVMVTGIVPNATKNLTQIPQEIITQESEIDVIKLENVKENKNLNLFIVVLIVLIIVLFIIFLVFNRKMR